MPWSNEARRITDLEERVAYLQRDLASTKEEAKKTEKKLKDKLVAAGAIISSMMHGSGPTKFSAEWRDAREFLSEFHMKRAEEAAEACERSGLLSNMDNVKERIAKIMFSLLKGD